MASQAHLALPLSQPINHGESAKGILQLPSETIAAICSHLPNSDIKTLRLSCVSLSATARLRFDRVFLSAQPREIEIFHNVARSDKYHSQVREIVYDDALFAAQGSRFFGSSRYVIRVDEPDDDTGGSATQASRLSNHYVLHLEPDDDDDARKVPRWFAFICEQNRRILATECDDRVEDLMTTDKSWEEYKDLLRKQRQVLKSNQLAEALVTGLKSFPMLRKITITPACHGRLFEPLYRTPTIRAMPYGLNYPVPSGWLPATCEPWFQVPRWSEIETEWMGFRLVMRLLANTRLAHNIEEIRVESHKLITGLNSNMFAKPNPALTDFTTAIAAPTFRRLHLDIICNSRHGYKWPGYNNDLLSQALADASGGRGLEHLSLGMHGHVRDSSLDPEYNPSLTQIIPLASLARLKEFRLSGFFVTSSDLIRHLAMLPETTELVEISLLDIVDMDYEELLVRIRHTLNWTSRDRKPRVSVGFPDMTYTPNAECSIDDTVNSFLYSGGPNPFSGRALSSAFGVMCAKLEFRPLPLRARWDR
ncbi:hypothetical protein EDB81DRAFT_696957 [Dactylonectria macrodidyma]|uniref:F-box domain-containing protein n=1 Tax=Dactylonectria macrodidyma TaxID=307937 RepID=A0A9P9E1D7_9HYPO|nr:hypothetical protein EDB81DRAFT_696957 [Dactylonectria macrodidyma]